MRCTVRIEPLEPRRLFAVDVHFSVDAGRDVHSISPFIYGVNGSISGYTNPTFVRSGGNRMTGHNWETNQSNAGADYFHHNDYHLTGGASNLPPGAAVSGMIQTAGQNGRGAIVTIPMAGYVSADANGTVDETQIAPSSRWRQVVAKKSTIYPGSPLTTNPNKTDGYVFTDEFVNWVQQTKQAGQQVFFNLDNEPGLWGEALPAGWQSGNPSNPTIQPSPQGRTHPTIHPFAPTFTEMRDKTIAHATAIKDVAPDALVFGGVGYGWNEFTTLQDAPGRVTTPSHPGGDQAGEMHYYEWLLNEMRIAETAAGRTLMDVIDAHWYPEARGTNNIRITEQDNSAATVAARLQAPRSLWDPTYTESSWITQFSTLGPINLLGKLKRDIADFKPGTKIAMTEYNYGGGNHISGGIAQADVLGILGREDVFAANEWPLSGSEQFIGGAFRMFRNYDGANGAFGDTSIRATTDNVANTSIYASYNLSTRNVLTLVAINKTAGPLTAGIALNHVQAGSQASVYRLTSASSNPVSAGTIPITNPGNFEYTMPAYSVTTLKINLAEPAPRAWTGRGDNVNWSNAANWIGNTVPAASDDVVISNSTGAATLTLDNGAAIAGLVSERNLTISGAGNLTVNGSTSIAGALSIQNGGRFNVAVGANALVRLTSLSITGPGSKLDLADNDLIVDYTGASPAVGIEALVRSAYNVSGDWQGAGITSSVAAADGNYVLAVADNASLASPFGTAQGGPLFAGVNVDLTTVLIKFTHRADLNLDGVITPDDSAIFGGNYDENQPATWASGDLNFDGLFTPDDAAIFGGFYDEALLPI